MERHIYQRPDIQVVNCANEPLMAASGVTGGETNPDTPASSTNQTLVGRWMLEEGLVDE